jgi:hypothetical protein
MRCPPLHHADPLLPIFSGVRISAANFILLLVRQLALDRIGMPFAAFVE